jgi:hypothetical protein
MGKGLFLGCLLAAAQVAAKDKGKGEEPMEIFIQTKDEDAPSEPMEIYIETEPQPVEPKAPPPSTEPSPPPVKEVRPAPEDPVPIEASATTTTPRAFLAIGDAPESEYFADGLGDASVKVQDKCGNCSLDASLRVGVDTWRVQLESAGEVRIGGLVLGRSGYPFRGAAAAISAFTLTGAARVEHNGSVVSLNAPVVVLALVTGIHADDDTHRRMPEARAGDVELVVMVPQLPRSAVPNGFLLMTWEDVDIRVQNQVVPSAKFVPTVNGLQDAVAVPTMPGPDFRGAATSDAAGDLIPLPTVGLNSTPQPLNSAPATPLALGISPLQGAPTPLIGGAVDPSVPAVPLSQGIAVLQSAPTPLSGGAGTPTAPASPLIPGIAPLNSQPLASTFGAAPPVQIGPGPVGPPQPTGAQTFQAVPPQTGALPTATPHK